MGSNKRGQFQRLTKLPVPRVIVCDRSASLRYSATGRIFVLRSSDVFDRDCHLSESYARCTCRFIFDSRVVSLKRDARREEKKEKDEARQVGREIALPRNCMLDVYARNYIGVESAASRRYYSIYVDIALSEPRWNCRQPLPNDTPSPPQTCHYFAE